MVEHLVGLQAGARVVRRLVLKFKFDVVDITATVVLYSAVVPVLGPSLHRSPYVRLVGFDQANYLVLVACRVLNWLVIVLTAFGW